MRIALNSERCRRRASASSSRAWSRCASRAATSRSCRSARAIGSGTLTPDRDHVRVRRPSLRVGDFPAPVRAPVLLGNLRPRRPRRRAWPASTRRCGMLCRSCSGSADTSARSAAHRRRRAAAMPRHPASGPALPMATCCCLCAAITRSRAWIEQRVDRQHVGGRSLTAGDLRLGGSLAAWRSPHQRLLQLLGSRRE